MTTITAHAFARAGLVGNPSDGYFGKTIAFSIRDFSATVHLHDSKRFEIVPGEGDLARFDSVEAFLRDQRLHGYYGGMRLIKAAIKRFHDYCAQARLALHRRSFTIEYSSTIPRLVGLAGSSAIIIATLRALMQFYEIDIPLHLRPGLALSVERDELHITAGLQDRVIQNYEGMVYMDFDRDLMESRGYGEYQPLVPATMPRLFVAYDANRAEVSDIPHRSLRELFERGDADVVKAMRTYRDLTDRGRAAILNGDWDALHNVINENYDLRCTIMNIAPENHRMVAAARSTGASAKFAGSGGAICGTYRDDDQYAQLVSALSLIGCTTLRPKVFEQG